MTDIQIGDHYRGYEIIDFTFDNGFVILRLQITKTRTDWWHVFPENLGKYLTKRKRFGSNAYHQLDTDEDT